jgi:Tol biopolymer transport system component
MQNRFPLLTLVFVSALCAVSLSTAQTTPPQRQTAAPAAAVNNGDGVTLARETRLRNVRQLTFGGENAEAYFSGDGKQLIFQSKRDGRGCDQIYTMRADGSDVRMVSTGAGATTCSYIFPDGRRILYASTHLASEDCPPAPDRSRGYVWAVHPGFDIFAADADGKNPKRLTSTPGYDAEATMSTDGRRIVFTSLRDGDLDIYSMDADGKNVKER